MSVVLAIKNGDSIIMAADSQFSRGGNKGLLLSPNLMKVWKPEGHPRMLMGIAGALRDQNILSVRETWYDPLLDKANEPFDFKFVVQNIIPEVLNELTNNGRTNQLEGFLATQCTLLVARDGNCFQMDADGCVSGELMADGEAIAVGSGSCLALAAYNALEGIKEIPLKEKLIRAVSQACQDDLYVGYPIVIMSTDSDNIEVFDGNDLYSLTDESSAENKEEIKVED